jgi:hypothetical protein
MDKAEAYNVATEALVSRACGQPCFVVRLPDRLQLKVMEKDVCHTIELPDESLAQFLSQTELVQFLSHQAVDLVRKAEIERNWAKIEELKAKKAREKR